ncbi:MAG: recombinase [Spirulina sp. SIO3F2]|nr:recombinase [Spirulina sp. SIO3F2]
MKTFKGYYANVFKLFPDSSAYPKLADFKAIISALQPGTKTHQNSVFALKRVATLSHDSRRILNYLNELDITQTEFRESQSISLEAFLSWHRSMEQKSTLYRNQNQRQSARAWLYVCAFCVVYGLRPSEAAAAKNLQAPFTIDGIQLAAITDLKNTEKLLYLGDFTYFGASIKTGSRICLPLLRDEPLFHQLLDGVELPQTKSRKCDRFLGNLLDWLRNNNCPVTQSYAFRHLGNQLGEQYGISQEVRSRSLGHSPAVNQSIYKRRSNTQTTIDILTNHSRQPLGLEAAKRALSRLGFDLQSPEVGTILRIIYQNPS